MPALGVTLGPIVKELGVGKIVRVEFFEGKIIAIDALPTLYEMLAMIRDKRGLYLVDEKGRVTSHLVGLFNRVCRMLAKGLKPVFIFDGPPHPLKMKELELRRKEKLEFQKKFIDAVLAGKYEEAKKLGKRAMVVNDEMIRSAKELLKLMGIPVIDAPHDGEAQAAYIVIKGDAFVAAVRDWDAFLYGAPRIVMDLKMSPNPFFKPRYYELSEFLAKAGITREQLVDLAILLGTDYNPGGFEGIGPKTALMLIKKYGSIEKLIKMRKIVWNYDVPPSEIRNIFLNPPIREDYKIEFKDPDVQGVIKFLVDEYNFSKNRVMKELSETVKRLSLEKKGKQASLDIFLGRL